CSGRRRHTRFSRDWSSDVCSSDLYAARAESWAAGLLDEAEAQIGRHEAANVPQLRLVPAPPRGGRNAPFAAELLVNQRLTGRGSTKDVRHLELDIEGSGLAWEPGDSLGVVIRKIGRAHV